MNTNHWLNSDSKLFNLPLCNICLKPSVHCKNDESHYLCAMKSNPAAHIALIISGILFGANYWIAKSLMPDYLTPSGIIVFRTSGALILFAAMLPFARRSRFTIREMILIAICGLSGITLNQYLFFEGLSRTTPVETSLIHTISPLLVVLLAVIINRERPHWINLAGVFAGLGGAVLLIAGNNELSWNSAHFTGNMLVVANITAYSLYLVLSKPLMNSHDPIWVTFWIFFAGWIFYAVPGWFALDEIQLHSLSQNAWLSLIYVVIGTTFLTYLLTMLALSKVKASTVGYYIFMQPLVSGFIGIVSGMEKLTFSKILAGMFIFAGVLLVTYRKEATTIRKQSTQ